MSEPILRGMILTEYDNLVNAYLSDDLTEACKPYGEQEGVARVIAHATAVQILLNEPAATRDIEAWRLEVMKRVAEILGEPS